jgi:hypothetical protein
MVLKALILLALLSRTPYYRDVETWGERESRMTLVGDAVSHAATKATCTGEFGEDAACKPIWGGTPKSLAMLLITQGVAETNLSHLIHDNQCRLSVGECDSTRFWSPQKKEYIYRQRSFSLWQIKLYQDISPEDWTLIQEGRPGTQAAAWAAARRLSGAYSDCGSIPGAISRYATGYSCQWKEAETRYAAYKNLMEASPESLETKRDQHREKLLEKELLQIASN